MTDQVTLYDHLFALDGVEPTGTFKCEGCGSMLEAFAITLTPEDEWRCGNCRLAAQRELDHVAELAAFDPLASAKESKRALVTIQHARTTHGGCVTPSGIVDTDEVSIRNITGARVQADRALATGTAFTKVWRMADNSFAELDALAMVAIGDAVVAHVEACYGISWTVKAQIEGCTTVEEVAMIDVEAAFEV